MRDFVCIIDLIYNSNLILVNFFYSGQLLLNFMINYNRRSTGQTEAHVYGVRTLSEAHRHCSFAHLATLDACVHTCSEGLL